MATEQKYDNNTEMLQPHTNVAPLQICNYLTEMWLLGVNVASLLGFVATFQKCGNFTEMQHIIRDVATLQKICKFPEMWHPDINKEHTVRASRQNV